MEHSTPPSRWEHLRYVAVVASALAFLAAIGLPVSRFEPVASPCPKYWYGLQFLIMGPAGPMVLAFGWYANPLMIAAWVQLVRRRYLQALKFSTPGFALALSTLLLLPLEFPFDGGHSLARWVKVDLGFYVWLLALALPLSCAAGLHWHSRARNARNRV